MLQNILPNPNLSLPADLASDGWRDTVVAVLTAPDRQAVAMVAAAKDITGRTVSFVQGGVETYERVALAARRETKEEIPSLARESLTAHPRVCWDVGRYLGSAENPHARSRTPKRLHFFVFPVRVWALRPDGVECRQAFWVRDPDTFAAMLDETRQQNPDKHRAICAAVHEAQHHGYLL